MLISGTYYHKRSKEGPYKDIIPVNGIVLPETTIYLDAVEVAVWKKNM